MNRLVVIGLTGFALLMNASQAGATSFSGSDTFYFPVTAASGYGGNTSAGITTSADGNYLYVAAGTVSQYATDGAFVRTFANKQGFAGAVSIGTDLVGNVYVLYRASQVVAKYTAKGKYLTSWSVTFPRAIGVSRGGNVYVLTNFLNAVAEYNSNGKSIGGFVANFPGQFFPFHITPPDPGIVPDSGYDSPSKTAATAITVDPTGNPVVAGNSYQSLSSPPPQCNAHAGFDDPIEFPDPLVSGEIVRFHPDGTLPAWGWLSDSLRDCFAGWHNEGTDATSVAVDPNTGQVYATSPIDLGVMQTDVGVVHQGDALNQFPEINSSGSSCYSYPCSADTYIADNPPVAATLDCRSNLYMLSSTIEGEFVTKFLNEDHQQASSCFNSRFALVPRLTLFRIKSTIKIGKEHLLMGCSGKLCSGTLALRSVSSLCRACTLTAPLHFRIRSGREVILTVRLLARGRRLLHSHPGFSIKVIGKFKGGRTFTDSTRLRAPSLMSARCAFPGTVGGTAGVSGLLLPARKGEVVTVQYRPPNGQGLLLPAVQHTVRTNRAGRFSDSYRPNAGGDWIASASWGGDRTHDPVASAPCSGTVQKVPTHITLNCPAASAVSAPAQFSGSLSGAPANAPVSVAYLAPSAMFVAHNASAGNSGNYGDSFTPTEAGTWQAFARYDGDTGHSAAQAACSFTVAPDDFSIASTPSGGSVAQGGSTTTTLKTSVTSGVSQSVALSESGAFPGSVSFSPSVIGAGGSSTATITTSASAAPGTYVISLTGTGPWATHSTTYKLTILAPTSLTLACTADPNRHFISCNGRLTSGAAGLGNAQISVMYTPPAGSPTVHTTMTAADGTYADTLNAAPGSLLPSGSWEIKAQFAGDATHAPSSKTQTAAVP